MDLVKLAAIETSGPPTFSGFVKAKGKIWKMRTRREQGDTVRWAEKMTYSDGILLANWNEDKYDISSMVKLTPLPSQYTYCYQSTYRDSYSKSPTGVPNCLKYTSGIIICVCVCVCVCVRACVCRAASRKKLSRGETYV